MKTIASFTVDHDLIVPGIYISRIDGDVITYDLRTRYPNAGDYMDHLTMHSVEHMFATLIRNSPVGDQVIYFGPMGCQTGFYLLMRDTVPPRDVYRLVRDTLLAVVRHTGEMFGAERKNCGNYRNLNLFSAKEECRRFYDLLPETPTDMAYPATPDAAAPVPPAPPAHFGVLAAMQEELEGLLPRMTEVQERTVAGIVCRTGTLNGKKVSIACAGVGKVNAALCTTVLISILGCNRIINTGVAGALSPDLKPLDLVVADRLVQYDMDTSAVGDPVGYLSGAGLNRIYLESDSDLRAALMSRAAAEGVPCRAGMIATADRFVASSEQKSEIRAAFPDAAVCEMEGAAVAQVCTLFHVPCLILRAVSDCADGSSSMDYPTFKVRAAATSASLTASLIAGAR